MFGLSMSLTSCDDILGEWSRPTPNPVTPGGGGSSAINATAITLKQTMKVLVKGGDALTITATATPAEATLTWESSDKAVATVENGVVTPVGAGIATITAKSGDVTATCEVFVGNEVTLSSSAYTAEKFDILKGDNGDKSITIPDGIKVAFNGISTTGQIICSGDATIILADNSTNTVTVSTTNEAGIKIGGTGKTLTINGETAGDGKLTVEGGSDAAGIGTNRNETGGNIVINGGKVTATGGNCAAGIGTGLADSPGPTNECGTITINGGTVTATGGDAAAGIGTGVAQLNTNTCGAITIDTGVTSVTATKGDYSPNSIGEGYSGGSTQTCGTIKIGGVVKNQSDFTGATYTYPEP